MDFSTSSVSFCLKGLAGGGPQLIIVVVAGLFKTTCMFNKSVMQIPPYNNIPFDALDILNELLK